MGTRLSAALEEANSARLDAEEAATRRAAAERALATARDEAAAAQKSHAQQQRQQQQQQQQSQAAPRSKPQQVEAAAALAERAATIEALMSERAALRFQLETERAKCQALEHQQHVQPARHSRQAVIDMPELRTTRSQREAPPPPRHLSLLLRANVKQPWPPLVQAAAAADDLADVLDRASLVAGRHLRQHRPLRLGAIGYGVLDGCLLIASDCCGSGSSGTASSSTADCSNLPPTVHRPSKSLPLPSARYGVLVHCWLLVLLMQMVPNLEPPRTPSHSHRVQLPAATAGHAAAHEPSHEPAHTPALVSPLASSLHSPAAETSPLSSTAPRARAPASSRDSRF